jgi:hypothetical protein
MAVKKSKGIQTRHIQRMYKDREIKPCKYFNAKTGSGIMVAQYKDTGDMVVDEQGKPVHWNSA